MFDADEAARERFRKLSERRYAGAMNGWETVLSLNVLQCPDCGHFWHMDQPDQDSLFAMYAARARQKRQSRSVTAAEEARIRIQATQLARLVGFRTNERPRLLDFGSGHGIWRNAFEFAGFDVTSFEPVAARAGLTTSGMKAPDTVHGLDELNGRKFDAVNIEQVLEHVPFRYPRLRNCSRIARRKP